MRRWRLIATLLVAGAVACFGIARGLGGLGVSGPQAGARDVAAAIPVMASEVRRADVPIFLAGLGTVQAFNSVLVKSRVDGQIVKINFSEGKDVHAGEVLVEIDPAPFAATLAQAQANKLKDQAQLDNTRLDLDRFTRLAKSGAGTTQQLDTTRALVAQFEASVKADQAMIDMAQVQLDYCSIRSPIEGRVGTRLVDVGNIVRATDATGIVTINQIHPIFVAFALPADSLPQLRAALKGGDIAVTALDSNGQELATGALAVIDNQINPATGTINYKAQFANTDDVLWPGQFVNARIQVAIRRNVIAVPVTAVQHGPDGPYAFVVGGDRVVQKRPIKVGILNKTTAIIDDGLQSGEQVVTDGQYRIQAGSKVEILTQAAASPG
jgi:multidrug efflux system membrane fusion protein